MIFKKHIALAYRTLLRLALKKVSNQICPSSIPRSGESGASIRCYSTFITLSSEITCLVTAAHENHVSALAYDDASNKKCLECSVPFSSITSSSLETIQYYGYHMVHHTGLWMLIAYGLSGYTGLTARFKNAVNSVAQLFYNKKKLQSKRRIELLSFLISTYTASSQNISLISLMSRIHTNRWLYHPDKEMQKKYLNLYLDSFVESGELTCKDSLTYKLTGKAIVTLENFENEERKHRDNFIIQVTMVCLTIALAFLATVQAGLIRLPVLLDFT